MGLLSRIKKNDTILPLSLGTTWPDWAILKVLGIIISNKSSPNDCISSGYYKKPHSYVNTVVATFGATFGKIWATFTPSSGPTTVRNHRLHPRSGY